MSMLEVLEVSRSENDTEVLHPISFGLKTGAKLAIAGATGSGKSTLLKLIAGLLQPTQGNIYFNGQKVLGPEEQLLPGHSAIAYLSQHFELRNNYYVHELLEMASQIEAEDAATIFRICRIDHLLKRRSTQLSGGERQRISLAVALIKKPKLLLLDEPFSNADMLHKGVLKKILEEVNTQLHTAIVLVSHDPLDVLPWAEQLMVLKDGKLIQAGSPADVYYYPKNEYVAGLTGHYNVLTSSELRTLGIEPHSDTSTMIVRPEQLQLNSNGKGIRGIIHRQKFLGTYNLIHLRLHDRELQVISSHKNWKVGQQIFVAYTGI